jgi:uncharacterized protein YjbI with pentapeptide repeats
MRGVNMAGANMAGANMSGMDLTGTNLQGANLTGANLAGAKLVRTNLVGASMMKVDLSKATLDNVKAMKATIGATKMKKISIKGGDFTGAMFMGSNAKSGVAPMSDAALAAGIASGAGTTRVAPFDQLDSFNKFPGYSNFLIQNADMTNAVFNGVSMSGAYVVNTNLRFAAFVSSDFSSGLFLNDSSFESAAFKNSNLNLTEFSGNMNLSFFVGGSNMSGTICRDLRTSPAGFDFSNKTVSPVNMDSTLARLGMNDGNGGIDRGSPNITVPLSYYMSYGPYQVGGNTWNGTNCQYMSGS